MSEVVLYKGDCCEIMKELEENSIDLILTDPPYGLGKFMRDRGTNWKAMRDNFFVYDGWDDLGHPEWLELMGKFFEQSSRIMKKGGSMIVFMSTINVSEIIELGLQHGLHFKTVGVWHKTNPVPRNMNLHYVDSVEVWVYFTYGSRTGTFNNYGQACHNFIETPVIKGSERLHGLHPTQKPKDVMSHFVRLLSNPGDWVCDPFMGSGTTGVVARELNRNFIGIEKDESHFTLSEQRINDYSQTSLF